MHNKPHTKQAREKMSIARTGIHYSVRTEFKKGYIPWNKGLKGVQKSTHKGKIIPWLKKHQYQSGKFHPNYKGGLNRNKHCGKFYKNWTKKVFIKDSFICQKCDQKGGQLEAHHIKSWVKYKKLRFEISNGITLCKNCHTSMDIPSHNIYYR